MNNSKNKVGKMPIKASIKFSVLALCALFAMGCTNAPKSPQISKDGLQLQYENDSTIAYKKAHVDFADYDKIYIYPSQVAFKKNWQRDYNRDNRSAAQHINDEEVLRIKTKVATLFDVTFKEELNKGETKVVVNEKGAGTLLLKPFIINLDINVPDIQSATNIRTYTRETGEATLYLEIFDGATGEILARIIDDEIIGDNNNSFMRWANRVQNTVEAKRTIKKWARSLNEQFDKAQAK